MGKTMRSSRSLGFRVGRSLCARRSQPPMEGACHGSTSSPSALSEEDSKGGVTVPEGSKVLARGTRSCT